MSFEETRYIGATVSPELADWIKETAKKEHRSISMQIGFMLESYKKTLEKKGKKK